MAARKSRGAEQGSEIVVGRELINDCVRYSAALDILYLNNPKCACTTVKHALWLASDALTGRRTFRGNVHDRKLDPFARKVFRLPARQRERVAQAAVFSVVRNPFARALSAYVDKVANDPAVWPIFLKRLGLKPAVGKKELSFIDFLGLIAVAHDDILDGHFRPQFRNLLLPLARPVFVGAVENMPAVSAFLEARGIPFRDEPMNATRAQERFTRLYDGRTASLVRKRYAEDFARFGYSTRLSDARARPDADAKSTAPAGVDRLLHWLAAGKPPDGIIEANRYFASFSATRDREKKLRLARRAFEGEHNWSRLQGYANFVRRRSRDTKLQEAIHERMASLRRCYAEAVSNPEIFVDFA